MVGDAFTFIDPMFSSGVFLAMQRLRQRPIRRCGAGRVAAPPRGPRDYSWFICRVTNPTIRDMFKHPNNRFKVIDCMVSVANWRRTYAGWKRHRFSIHDMGSLRDETIMKAA